MNNNMNSNIKNQREISEADNYIRKNKSTSVNAYFLKISNRFKLAKIVSIFLLCIFILGSILVFGEQFTYENARFVLRDLSQILKDDSSEPKSLYTFDADGSMDFVIYKSSIVICGESGVKILGMSGMEKVSDTKTFTSPVAVPGDKYLAVYSLGGNNLSIYNTVARIYDFKFDYPIYDVSVSDNGYIAVMTQTREYRSTVYLYDPNFSLIATYNKKDYPIKVNLSDNAEYIYISTLNSENGEFYTEVSSYKKGSADPYFKNKINDFLCIDVQLFDDGNLAFISDDKVLFYSQSGEKINAYNNSLKISKLSKSDKTLSIMYSNVDSNLLVVLDSIGNVKNIQSKVTAHQIHNNNRSLFMLDKNVLTQFTESKTKFENIDSGAIKLISTDDYVFICYPNKIKSIKIN